MADYVIRIRIEGDASGGVGALNQTHSALGNIAQIAAGGLGAMGIASLGSAIAGTARQAIDAVSNYERLGMSLEALLAREIKNASGIEKTITVGQQRIQLTEKEIAVLGKLRDAMQTETLQRDVLSARIQEQKERIRQLTMQYGENGLVVIKERAELALMEQQYAKSGTAIDKYGSKIAELEGKQGKLVSVTQKVVEGQLSMNEALAQAGPKAAELIGWVEKLAILSPFKSEDIAASLQQAMNFQFSSEMAKRLTQDLVDMAAATGKTGDSMRLISYAMGQINLSDKLLMQDLRQLINAGVDVETVLNKMGFSLSDVGEKAINSKKFIEVLLTTLEEDFGGAAARSATSLTGLLTSLDEIKDISLRELFSGALDALKPLLAGLVELATSGDFRARLRGIGEGIGDGIRTAIGWIQQGIAWVGRLWGAFQRFGVGGILTMLGFHPAIVIAVKDGLRFIAGGIDLIVRAFGAARKFGVGGFLTMLGFAPGTVMFVKDAVILLGNLFQQLVAWGQQLAANVLPLINQGITWFQQNLQNVGVFLAGFLATFAGGQGLVAVLAFAAAALPAIGAAIAGVLALITSPLFLIAAAVGLIAVAWTNNWGGIQEIVFSVWAAIQPVLQTVVDYLLTVVAPAFVNLWNQAGPALSNLGGFFNTVILPALSAFVGWLQVYIPIAVQSLQQALTNLQPVWALVGRGVTATISILQSLSNIWTNLNRLVNELVRHLQGVILKFLGIDQSAAATQARLNGVGEFLKTLGELILQFYQMQLKQLLDGFSALVGFLESLAYWLGIVADALANLKVPEAFQRHSPSPFEQMLMNSNSSLREMRGLLPTSLGRLGNISPRLSRLLGAHGITTIAELRKRYAAFQKEFGHFGNTSLKEALNLADSLLAQNPSFGRELALAGAGGSSTSYDQHNETHINGPITVMANNPREFENWLANFGGDVQARVRMGE